MSKTKKVFIIILKILKIAFAGIVALLILNLFAFLYGYSGIHIENDTGATDYKWLNNLIRTNCEEGFSFFRFDNEGFNNKEKYSGKPDILLMGSSHMEAVQVKQEENTGYLLNEYLDYHTYNIGISGHTIYSCVKNLSKANAYYSPSNYIIIETDSVELNNDKMEEVLKGKYPTIPSYSSGAFYQSQIYFPVVKMMYKKILDWKSADVIDSDHNNQASTETYLNLFLKKAKTDAGHATLIIMYHPSINFNNSGKMIVNNDGVDKFEKSCKENGIVFVNMTNYHMDLSILA